MDVSASQTQGGIGTISQKGLKVRRQLDPVVLPLLIYTASPWWSVAELPFNPLLFPPMASVALPSDPAQLLGKPFQLFFRSFFSMTPI